MSLRGIGARAVFAGRRPGMAVRRLRGKPVIEIGVDEIARFVDPPDVIVEAGALDGSDTVRLAAQWPTATVHAFEPVPSAYAQLAAKVDGLPNVRTYQCALAAETGSQEMFISSAADGTDRPDSSSLLAPTGHLDEIPQVRFNTKVMVETWTLDDWAARESLQSVDLMWLDMQGLELSVLKASQKTLATASAVVMEVSRREMYAGSALYPEVVAWMEEAGFSLVIDRVSFLFGNALFVRR